MPRSLSQALLVIFALLFVLSSTTIAGPGSAFMFDGISYTTGGLGYNSYTPTCADGSWSITIPANTLPANSQYYPYSQINPVKTDQAAVNGTSVQVTSVTFNISAN